MNSKILTGLLLILFVVVLTMPGEPVFAQENSICGWVDFIATPGGQVEYDFVMTLWETGEIVHLAPPFFVEYDNPGEQQWANQFWSIILQPGYYRIYNPVRDNGWVTSFGGVESVSGCEPVQVPSEAPTQANTQAAEASIPTTQFTAIPPVFDLPNPKDGYDPGPPPSNWIEQVMQLLAPPVEASRRIFTPAECQSEFFIHYTETGNENCTWFAAGLRPDVCQWVVQGQGNACQWAEHAKNNGGALGVSVNNAPGEKGAIVVWPPGCAGATEYGHVAIVDSIDTGNNTIKVRETNWPRSNPDITIETCMAFIGNPAPVPALAPASISTPEPVLVPTPSGQSYNFFQWLIDIFK